MDPLIKEPLQHPLACRSRDSIVTHLMFIYSLNILINIYRNITYQIFTVIFII